jgi:ribonucleoside-diphosphate reductase alpha chain
MVFKLKKIKKRDGRLAGFDAEKITRAIYKASEAVGEPDYDLAKDLTKKVIFQLEKTVPLKKIPTVEEVQDIVERTLIENKKARIAKAYILYRQKRAEIRREKQQILNKIEIDEVDKKFDINALRVLSARYLRKDALGKVIESPKQLFERVAVHNALPSLFYDKNVFRKAGRPNQPEEINLKEYYEKLKIGDYSLNEFHLEALRGLYDRFNKKGQMKLKFSGLLKLFKKQEFDKYGQEIKQYYDLLAERKFIPNTPALANFGNPLGMGIACYVLDIEDSLDSIMETLKNAALIFKSGGGVGYNFSKLRPEGDFVKTTHGAASGPISFMVLFDQMTDVVKQGGIRRGANMGILNIDHPDIEAFVSAKRGNLQLRNFNISVFLKENFWKYLRKNKPYPLINPRTGGIVKYVDLRAIFDLIVYQGWESAEPGLIFDDNVNKYNPFFKTLGPIWASNPCGEVLLYPYESCVLGSINLWAFIKEKIKGRERKVEFDWEAFRKTIRLAARFLDNLLDATKYPLPEIEEMTLATRKIGLGIMGLGDLLYEMKIPYNSKAGFDLMERLMEFLNYHSKLESIELARERGKFPHWEKSFYPEGKLPFFGFNAKKSWRQDWQGLVKEIKKNGLRNAYTTVIAPTGSISMIAGCSVGMEPVFSLVYEKKVTIGSFYYVNPVFEKTMEREGLFDEALIKNVSGLEGGCQKLNYIPPRQKRIFVTAMDIEGKDHIGALASIQKWTDSSVSKTINFSEKTSVGEMKKAYLLAYRLGCKDLTVFRYKSIKGVYLPGAKPTFAKATAGKEEEKKKLTNLRDVKAKGPSIYREAGAYEEIKEGELETEEGGDEYYYGPCPTCKIL